MHPCNTPIARRWKQRRFFLARTAGGTYDEEGRDHRLGLGDYDGL